jgi:diguanylate cyclase (GGDEF)-like protein
MIDLLRFSMEIQYSSALNSNPLTHLPGNKHINEKLGDIIHSGAKTCILYLDLNFFKAYNDVYGFGRGDTLIIMTRNVVCSVIDSHSEESFVGHIGGDDFMICVRGSISKCEQICREIIHKFNRSVIEYYNEEDRKRGYITTESRTHKIRTYPLMQLSIGGLFGQFGQFDKPEELAEYIGKLKKKAKSYEGSTYVIEELQSGRIYSNQK